MAQRQTDLEILAEVWSSMCFFLPLYVMPLCLAESAQLFLARLDKPVSFRTL
jgi:hypothetical protein